MLALQGTLTVPSFYGVSSSMDEYALESGHASPSGSMGWRTRAPTSRYRPQLPQERVDLGSTGLAGECSILRHCASLMWITTMESIPKLGLILVDRRLLAPLTINTNILLAQLPRALAPDSRNPTHTSTDKV